MEISGLSYRHTESGPYFFKDLTFSLKPNAINALHGKNGVGKSVLLHLLAKRDTSVMLMDQKFDRSLIGPFSFLENLAMNQMGKFP
ncbi:MAG: transporter, partial [Chlamydiota bacterium]